MEGEDLWAELRNGEREVGIGGGKERSERERGRKKDGFLTIDLLPLGNFQWQPHLPSPKLNILSLSLFLFFVFFLT